MNLGVLGDRVLVKTEPQGEFQTATGLYAVEDYAPHVVGTVTACPDGGDVRIGDVVIFTPEAGQVLDHEGDSFLVLQSDEILAVVE